MIAVMKFRHSVCFLLKVKMKYCLRSFFFDNYSVIVVDDDVVDNQVNLITQLLNIYSIKKLNNSLPRGYQNIPPNRKKSEQI